MWQEKLIPMRFIGLDVHKHYLVAIGVDAELNQVLGPQRVQLRHLDSWIPRTFTCQDAVVLEMTTNAFQLHDDLRPHVHSVTLVHPVGCKNLIRAFPEDQIPQSLNPGCSANPWQNNASSQLEEASGWGGSSWYRYSPY